MTVYFIGAGPGAADLMTIRGKNIIEKAPYIMYAGALVPNEVLSWCNPDATTQSSSDLTIEEITATLVEQHNAGNDIARLHSGDPAVFSAVAEQVRRLREHEIPYEIVPGVPAFAAAAAALGEELTRPGIAQSVVLTRIARNATAMPPTESLAAFAATGATLAIHLAVQRIDEVVAELVPHYGDDCPAAVCGFVSQPGEKLLRGTLGDIAATTHEAGLTKQSIILVGRALGEQGFCDSHLYSHDRQMSRR